MHADLLVLLRDVARLRVLAESGLMDSDAEPRFDRYTKLAAQLLHAPTALITLVDDQRQFFKSHVGLREPWATRRGSPLSHSFCKHVVASGEPLAVNDATRHPLVRDNPAIAELGIVAYAGAPLQRSGATLGVLCVADSKARAWSVEQLETLRALATAVSSELELGDVAHHSRTTQALREAEEELRLTVEHAPYGVALVAPDGRWLRVNDAMAAIVGYSRAELLQIDFQRLTHPDDLAADLAQVDQLLKGEIPRYEMQKRYIHRSGDTVWVHLAVSLVRSSEGRPRFFIAQVKDITARVMAERAAATQAATVKAVIESMSDVVMVADPSGQIVLLNEVAKRLYGDFPVDRAPAEWAPGEGLFLSDGITRCPPDACPLARALRGESVEQCELWMRLPGWSEGRWQSVTGNPVRDREGRLIGAVHVGRDITARKTMEDQIRRAALTDELTGLYNRRGFTLMAEQQLRVAQRHKQTVHLFFIDLDGMKRINDELGHDLGDNALITTAKLLKRMCRGSDVVARLGGDEFVVLAENSPDGAAVLVSRLMNAVAHRNSLPGHAYELSLSLGIARYDPRNPALLSQLLSEADQAMYEAKRAKAPARVAQSS